MCFLRIALLRWEKMGLVLLLTTEKCEFCYQNEVKVNSYVNYLRRIQFEQCTQSFNSIYALESDYFNI